MCEYQRIINNLPMCIGTKQLCTLCVTGNMDTYNKLEQERNENIKINNNKKVLD